MVIAVSSLTIRIVPQLGIIYAPEGICFKEVDPWYHMRLVDNMYRNFPHPLKYDNYATLGGRSVLVKPLLSWIIVEASKVLGEEPDKVAPFVPPIIGTLSLIPTFFIGRALFSSGVALLSCFLVSVLPSEFLHRTLLGFVDHHCLEALFSMMLVLFLVLFEKTRRRSCLIGAFASLGLLFLSWHGAPLFLLPSAIWGVCYLLVYYRRLAVYIVPIGVVAAGLLMSFLGLWKLLFEGLKFIFWGVGSSISEATPSTLPVYLNKLGLAFLLMPVGAFYYIKRKNINLAFVIFSAMFLLMEVGQRRWNYYSVFPMSILAASAVPPLANLFQRHARGAIVFVIILFLTLSVASRTLLLSIYPNVITRDWFGACCWLRENTEEPFDSDIYHALTKDPIEPSYTVLSWWDYGHWIIRIGKRVPLVTPAYHEYEDFLVNKFLLSKSYEEAEELAKRLKVRYVIVDDLMVSGKFYAIVERQTPKLDISSLIKEQDRLTLIRLWREEMPGYTLVYKSPTVKVFEREAWNEP